MTDRPPPRPPRPDLWRRPREPFGWLEVRFLHHNWLRSLGPDAAAVLLLLALAADGRGASYYGRNRMAGALGMARDVMDQALDQLTRLGLVAFRPWNRTSDDGVWQLLPLPPAQPDNAGPSHSTNTRHSPPSLPGPVKAADIIQQLVPQQTRRPIPDDTPSAPEFRGS